MTQDEIIERKNQLYSEKMNLESQLSSTDYKVIKCAEAQAAGEPMPYDAEALHTERQQWRDRINSIDEELEELDNMEVEEERPDQDIPVGEGE